MAGQTSKLLIAVSCALHFMLVSPSSAQTHEIAEDLLKSNLYDEAKQIWEKLAASGDHLAEKRLGDLYYLGTGLKRD